LLLLLSVVYAQDDAVCQYTTQAAPAKAEGMSKKATCGWYDGDSCCPTFDSVYPLYRQNVGLSLQYGYECSEVLEMLTCSVCSPTVGVLNAFDLCKGFVDRLWAACRKVTGVETINADNTTTFDAFPPADTRIDIAYADKKEWYSQWVYVQGLPLITPNFDDLPENSDDTGCFNAAPSAHNSAAAVLAALSLLVAIITTF